MKQLKTKIDLFAKKKVNGKDRQLFQLPNLCEFFDEDDLSTLASDVMQGFQHDEQSRAQWMRRTASAMDLAMQVVEDKNFPWPGCSNIKFPLVTIATLQFHSRAYPTLIDGTNVVGCRVIGEDQDGTKQARADRISTHMSYQRLEQDQPWEEQHDRLLINVPIVGCAFKKQRWDTGIVCGRSELVLAQNMVLNYYAKSVEDCPRKTEVIDMQRNDIYARVKRGTFRDILGEAWFDQPPPPRITPEKTKSNNRNGVQPPPMPDQTSAFTVLEQHVNMDLDQDGYDEPYIITAIKTSEGSGCVVRIVARFDRIEDVEFNDDKEVVWIYATEYYTKYPFIPSPDGGIYDMGFGVLLGPLNESTNTIINQLVDVGTMQATAGGFLGRGVKIRGGAYTFAPLEWKRVDSTGDDLSKNIVPLPVREPSAVLFQLLSLLIGYVNRISGTTDQMVGENPGQNTPAYNQQSMIEQGMKVYNAIFKRMWRAEKEEFKKLYKLNAVHLNEEGSFGAGNKYLRQDYLGDPNDVVPYADPNMATDADREKRDTALLQMAMSIPGFNKDEAVRRSLRGMRIENIQQVFPGSQSLPPPPPDVKIQVEQMKSQREAAKLKQQHLQFIAETMESHELTKAKIVQLEAAASLAQAQAALAMEQAGGVAEGHKIAQFDAIIGIMKEEEKAQSERIKTALKAMDDEHNRTVDVENIALEHRALDLKEKEINKPAPAKASA